MLGKVTAYLHMIADLKETRQQVMYLRNNLGIELGDIQVGYETAIESILEIIGMTEDEIDMFWSLSEPEED